MKLMSMLKTGEPDSRWFVLETGPDGRTERSRIEIDENGNEVGVGMPRPSMKAELRNSSGGRRRIS